ncbi:MAG TPA: 4-alpha-glucanotransferase [Vicinamibacterales bacterium]|nr:4-alpha-glucanotransferase [Vicinamibacterales bacterium]
MPEATFADLRHAGALVPLFSIPSRESWGIGEISDLPLFAEWLDQSGLDFVMLLPVNEMADGQNSPYSALSAMAIDPLFIALRDVEEFQGAGGEPSLSDADRTRLDEVRRSPRVDYDVIRDLKSRALVAAFRRFEDREWTTRSARARQFQAFRERETWWLADYALFTALNQENGGRYWLEWNDGLRDRRPEALAAAERRLEREIRYRGWLQWIADEQWHRARREAQSVAIFGDFPFVVSAHSADVWARQHEFRIDVSIGTPPDAFSATGQDWGLPLYRWDVIEQAGDEWLRQRGQRSADLYDGFRVDHLIGFYRTYYRERDKRAAFVPPDEPSQIAQGERILRVLAGFGTQIVAEDLGSVPDFVRASLARLHVPGYKVLRWERHWEAEGKPFRDPTCFPPLSLATTGTHDTETLAEWWDEADSDERQKAMEWPYLKATGRNADATFDDCLRDALLRILFNAGSNLVVVPVQDIFGWKDRINTPAVVDDVNWRWRMPWPVEDLSDEPVPRERSGFLRQLSRSSGRYLR